MAAQRQKDYWANGAAAYDIYSNAAKPLELPQELPEERLAPARKQKVKVKAKAAIAPFALVGMLVVVCLLLMVIHGYVQLYEASSAVGKLNDQLAEVEKDNAKLLAAYESSIDLTAIELQARALGMKQPNSNQTVYLNISGTDKAVVLETENDSIFEKTWTALKEGFMGILEYFT